jgi:multisubunit Na+/H+ antiporter MnhE subunit
VVKLARFKVAPLSGSFMVAAIVGFLISAFYIFPKSRPWGLALVILFIVMFLAGMRSARLAPVEAELAKDKIKE